jgi:hypothetical protein
LPFEFNLQRYNEVKLDYDSLVVHFDHLALIDGDEGTHMSSETLTPLHNEWLRVMSDANTQLLRAYKMRSSMGRGLSLAYNRPREKPDHSYFNLFTTTETTTIITPRK